MLKPVRPHQGNGGHAVDVDGGGRGGGHGGSVARLAPGALRRRECLFMTSNLTDAEITRRLAELPEWQREGDAIVRDFTASDFPGAIAFVVRVGFAAERLNHHPDLDVRWRTVRAACTTHDAGGLTERDFELAGELDRAFGGA